MINVTCVDSNGEVIENFTQWDLDQTIYIETDDITTAPDFHFFNKKDTDAIVVSSTLSNGVISVDVPNKLLQRPYPIIAYMYVDGRSLARLKFPMARKPKPTDYNTYTVE